MQDRNDVLILVVGGLNTTMLGIRTAGRHRLRMPRADSFIPGRALTGVNSVMICLQRYSLYTCYNLLGEYIETYVYRKNTCSTVMVGRAREGSPSWLPAFNAAARQ